MTYTTQELIEILDRELQANWQGKRVVLSSAERINDPVVAKLLDMARVSKVFAYQDFRQQIHEYQKQHQVSGIIWRDCTFQKRSIRCPEICNQLIPIDGDKEILVAQKQTAIDFWHEVTAGMNFWLVNTPGTNRVSTPKAVERLDRQLGREGVGDQNKLTLESEASESQEFTLHHKIGREYVQKLIRQAEWAEIDATRTELYLGLCWGHPAEYRYQWAKPKSGCDRIVASYTRPSAIKI